MKSSLAQRGMPTRSLGLAPSTSPTVVDGSAVERVLHRGREHLLGLQQPDGHWCAELEGDTILESEYILLQAFLGRVGDPRIAKCARYLLQAQTSNGGWSIYPGGLDEISASVKSYFALKIAGYRADTECMKRARFAILEMGGAENVNSFTRFYLAGLGQLPYSHCPSVPPELALLPKWFPASLHNMSAWTRTIVVPLSLVHVHKPVTPLPASMGMQELFRAPPTAGNYPKAARVQGRLLSWANFFRIVDRGIKVYESLIARSWRRGAIRAAERWMIDRFEGSDGLGAIFPPMVYTIMALKCLGYSEDSHEFRWAEKQLEDLAIDERDTRRLQPCVSPVWDTALALIALGDTGLSGNHPALRRAADWLLAREVRRPGDWAARNPGVEPSGWVFEYNNQFYPDVDDTIMVLMALKRSGQFSEEPCQQAVRRALHWLTSMQCRDHGWAAFDKDINNRVLESIPFADHNAMLDPSCPDITARVLEALGQLGYQRGQTFIDDALAYIISHQEPEGCWYGRWGVNYIYGTWQVLVGLASIGYDMRHPRVRKAVDWLQSVQQENGGWGETCGSYDDRSLMGQGETTPSQTAWALLGLMAAGEAHSRAVTTGIEYLCANQQPDGGWLEPQFTGTGFPKVFYLRYHYYRLYFPLMALARYRDVVHRDGHGT